MNLPTREEAKAAIENIKLAISDTHTGRIQNIRVSVQVALKILEAYSSGSLIEARTEGEIGKLIETIKEVKALISCQFYGDGTICNISRLYAENIVKILDEALARALVGKV
jgi:hypothetical protein